MRARARALVALEATGLVAFLGLVGSLLWGPDQDQELFQLDAEVLAVGPTQERWYGIFFEDQHVGFSVTRTATTEDGGKLYEGRSNYRFATFGTLQEIFTAGAALTDEHGALQRFDFFMASELVRLSARGEVRGTDLVMEIDQAGETSSLTFPLSRPPQVDLSIEGIIAARELSVGDQFTVPYFSPVTLSEGEMVFDVTDVQIVAGSEEAYWIETTFSDLKARMLVTPSGEVLRQESALGMKVVRMEAEAAQAVPTTGEPVDLIALSAVQVKGKMKNARGSRRLALKITGIEPEKVRHDPPLQTRVGDTVSIDVPLPAELPGDLPVADRSELEWIEGTITLPVGHTEIRDKSQELLGEFTDRRSAVEFLNQWVYTYIEKVPSPGVPNGLTVLRTASGDCNEHTALFVSLARAAGIPTRIAAGVVYSDRITGTGAFYYHAWPEVRLGGPTEWVPIDPTFGQFPADATHIKLVEGDLDRQVEIMGFLGRLGFEVVDLQ